MARRARQDHSGEQGRDARVDRAREVGLFRYALIRTAADPALSTRQRGRLVRDLAAREHTGPFGQRVRISRVTIDRWILVWRRGGFDALLPSARYAQPRTAAAVLELAAALKREVPARTAAQVRAILLASPRRRPVAADPATPLRPPRAQHPPRRAGAAGVRPVRGRRPERAVDRGCAARPGRRRPQDLPVRVHRRPQQGPGRLLVGSQRGHRPPRSGAARGPGIPRCPASGLSRQRLRDGLLAAAAGLALGITLTHSKPGQPAGRGKIEKFFRTVRERFLVGSAPGALAAVQDLVRLNELFAGWVETVYHARVQRDRAEAAGTVPRARPTVTADRADAARGVLVVAASQGDQDRDDQLARQPLRGRRRAGRPHGRGRVRPVRPDHPPDPLPGPVDGDRGPAPDRPPRPPRRPP